MRIDAARRGTFWPGIKKNFPIPRDEISKFQGVAVREGIYALYRNKRNPMGGSAKYISHRSCSRQSLSYRDRSIFDGANTAVRRLFYLQYKGRGRNETVRPGLSFMFLNRSTLTFLRGKSRGREGTPFDGDSQESYVDTCDLMRKYY